ncbi:hypothetical protein A3C17_03840 [Candidatus Uhrbacteria bacterium RIFCSPHIGHO2_02_FULL_53_13]|uniref:Aminoglycoside phosphotransferase domain-containing protein n=2 Tax=Candidatus Uhriibacteriota TaxID=1752732 RepID=A0A1F7U0F8_9BACT|nr:MAG: hypothetical protein A3C17_03840 [Candidatus Uhrbacteria bacterium RIFCSPHIGHO2_02_FULL_53_13]OGL89975.1 MAG: hypothetical protein A3I45_02490 [Candidatus Uhrbacteria bacterium RIFCSPLOWO2_02_FULL_53_10]
MSIKHPGIALRERLLCELDLTLERVFDTNAHEPDKDVCLVKDVRGQRWVLRSGERRNPSLFPNGFVGEHVVIPTIHITSAAPVYELEQYLEGDLAVDSDRMPNAPFPQIEILDLMFLAFWEWQKIGNLAPLQSQESHAETHLQLALLLISDDRQKSVKAAIDCYRAFFDDVSYPAKWKYSDDNLLLMADGKLGFIDNARMGLRFWGYDIGWIYWPRWFRMGQEAWGTPDTYIARFERFLSDWYASKPSDIALDRTTFDQRVHLGLLTRIVGALFDVHKRISHAEHWLDTHERRSRFLSWTTALLDWNLKKLM